jgi:hypothetical protein
MLGFKKCAGCGKKKWGVKVQTIIILGQKATLQGKEICRECAKRVEKMGRVEKLEYTIHNL